MALRYTSPCFTVSRETPKSLVKAVMLPTRCHARPKKVMKSFNFSTTTKIYEDKAKGIVGYKDKIGVIYEGFDEGPRLTHEDLETINEEREAHTKEQIQKQLFDVFRADNRSLNYPVLLQRNEKMK